MLKIGEFSKLTQVSIRMLRYYDETGLLKPAAINKFTNYRQSEDTGQCDGMYP
jgi:DNA-binding transcriptional MerR regulator